MAESILVDQDQFNCPVCLDLLKDPVCTPCGHSFCLVCINRTWDNNVSRRVYSCPYCKKTFKQRPVLCKNIILTEVVEKVRKNKLQPVLPAHCYAGPGDVECDSCSVRKRKAVNSCLRCLASYCVDHLKAHHQSPAFKKHKLIEARAELQNKICFVHDKLFEFYCRTDQRFVCCLCLNDEHKDHDTVAAETQRNKKQKKLKKKQTKFQQRLQEKQRKLEELKQTMDNINRCSQAAVDNSEKIFAELTKFMKKMRSETRVEIRRKENAELSQAKELLNHLEQEITDLKKRVTDMEQLSHTQDHVHFLQNFPALRVSPECKDPPNITVNQNLLFDQVWKSLSALGSQVGDICDEEFDRIDPQAEEMQMTLTPDPWTRDNFLQYFTRLTFDPDTANQELIVNESLLLVKRDALSGRCQITRSENNTVVTWNERDQQYPDHPERFEPYAQVLCEQSVSERAYWEVECSVGCVNVAVSYKEISRKGDTVESVLGRNNQSWSLEFNTFSFSAPCYSTLSFWHDNVKTVLPGPLSSRIGVYVDHSAGILSFYGVSDRMRLLHRIHTTFTRPLYAGFSLSDDATVKLCRPRSEFE